MTTTWADAERFLLEEAECDLVDGPMARPCLLAFRRDEALAVAFLREFEKGEYHDAIIELLALVCPLGADRLALSVSGRAWSWDDPIPPVVDGVGDLRQRVVALEFADRFTDPVLRSSVHPFEVRDGRVEWGDVVRDDRGSAGGWISEVLRFAVTDGYGRIPGSDRDIRHQLNRCSALGHLVGIGPTVARRLRLVDA